MFKSDFDFHKSIIVRTIDHKFGNNRTLDDINNIVQDYSNKFEEELFNSGISLEGLFVSVRAHYKIQMKRDGSIYSNNRNHVEWYTSEKKENRQYWDRYKQYLTESSMPRDSREKLDEWTDNILSQCEDPRKLDTSWSIKGLVHGSVQSGKTANYIGLINKAADAGYKLFIVLTGMYNDLRTQTQIRFDEGFIGYESSTLTDKETANAFPIGVGLFDRSIFVSSLTHRRSNGDFKKNNIDSYNPLRLQDSASEPYIIVCKKNKNVLDSILKWLDRFQKNPTNQKIENLPIFVLDDEADQASPSNRPNESSPINTRIRKILNSFSNSTYLSYTATPYANLLINPKRNTPELGEDIFPKDFIVGLPIPDNYVGFEDIFPSEDSEDFEKKYEESQKYIRIINDHYDPDSEDGWMPHSAHRDNTFIPLYRNKNEIPPSLKRAIYTFLLCSAAKSLRRINELHSSMMVHVTYKNIIQDEVKQQIHNFIDTLKVELPLKNESNEHWKQLKSIWENDLGHPDHINKDEKQISWSKIMDKILYPNIDSILDRLDCIQLSNTSADILNYKEYEKKGSVLIVLGGNRLSRGITLSGLCVSYFSRYSSQRLADTVTQMARWFGYRDGYQDLCRVYLTEDLRDVLSQISGTDEELRAQIDLLQSRSDITPDKYPIYLRSFPGLMVTNKTRMKESSETYSLRYDDHSLGVKVIKKSNNDKNKEYFDDLINKLDRDPDYVNNLRSKSQFNLVEDSIKNSHNKDLIWRNVDFKIIIDFFSKYIAHSGNLKINTEAFVRYINMKVDKYNELTKWNIVLKSRSKLKKPVIKIGKYEVIPSLREVRKEEKGIQNKDFTTFGTLFSGSDSELLLNDEEFKIAESKKTSSISQKLARSVYSQGKSGDSLEGFLFLYPVVSNETTEDVDFAIGVVFPQTNTIDTIEYTINSKVVEELRQQYGDDIEDDLEENDDE